MSRHNLIQLAADRLGAAEDGSRAASKYDFVKVKVWLGEDMAHYYVLSRFLISRMLTVTKVPHQKAVKIALDVKKHLVDNDRLDITQGELEAILFSVMRGKGFGDEFINRYKMVNQFFQQKRPLIILICGSACTGKSTFAQQLASRLNLPNVLQTDILYELLRTSEWGALSSTPLWAREGLAEDELISEFQKECRIIRRGLDGDLCKCIKDGKPIIIEGLHLDPGIYLDEFGRHGIVGMGGALSLELPAHHAEVLPIPRLSDEQAAGTSGGASESVAASPPSLSGPLSCSSDDGEFGTFPPAPTPCSSGKGPNSPAGATPGAAAGAGDEAVATAEDEALPTRRSASFNDAAASGLAYTSPAYSKQSPWRHLRPGGFLDRLLHRPRSAREPPEQLPGQQPEQQGRLGPRGVLRTASLGQVTFMLQQAAEAGPLAPIPVMPGAEVLLPASLSSLGEQPIKLLEEGEEVPVPVAQHGMQRGQQGSVGEPAKHVLWAGSSGQPGPLQPAAASSRGAEGGEQPRQQQVPPLWGVQQGGQGASPHALANGSTGPSQPAAPSLPDGRAASSPDQGAETAGARPAAEAAATHTSRGPEDSSWSAAVAGAAVGAAADATAAAPAAGAVEVPRASPRDSQGPVFVPLVLAMNEQDYELVVQEWQAAQTGVAGEPPGASGAGDLAGEGFGIEEPPADAVLHRLRVLQKYLCAYGAVGVPVVGVNVGSFHETLDRLHDYLLRCIEMSL